MIEALAELYPFQSHFLELAHEGARYHYLDEGPSDAPPLLCLHGNPTWSFYWRRVVAAFRGDHRVVAPDHLGCGLSDKPASFAYTLEAHVANLERLVLALDLERITLVLHDWGGAIGMGLARRHPERIARLVVTNTAAFPCPSIPWRLRLCRAPVLGDLLVRRLDAFSGLAVHLAAATRLAPDVKRGLRLPYRSYAHRIATHRFVLDIPGSPDHPSYAELAATGAALERFRDRPACIVWGERDWCFTPRILREWEERLPAAEVHRLPHAAHYVLEDAPDDVLAALRGFFRAHPVPAALRT